MESGKWTYRQEYVKCGKYGCKKCPHGPYWYGYRREGTRLKKKYFGKKRPFLDENQVPDSPLERLDDIFHDQRASLKLACEILGVTRWDDRAEVNRVFKRLVLEHHPDRGGDAKRLARVTAAMDYLRKFWDD